MLDIASDLGQSYLCQITFLMGEQQMSQLVQVAEIAGTTTTDVVRVLSHGGTTQTDWAIAHAIEQVTGRDAYELMLTAGRTAEVARIWADTGTPAEAPAQTNPRAEYDPTVTIYPENTSPEDSNRIAPHHPGDTEDTENVEDDDQAERVAAQNLADQVFSDLAEVTNSITTAHLATGWHTPAETRRAVRAVLLTHPATARRARYRARLQHHLATA